MTTAGEIVVLAYREANFKGTVDALSTEEQSEGLTLLKSIVDSFFGLVVGTRAAAWHVPSLSLFPGSAPTGYPVRQSEMLRSGNPNDAYPPPNVRLLMRNETTETLYLPFPAEDGAMIEYVDAGHVADVVLNGNGSLFGLSGSVEEVAITPLFPAGRNTPRRWVYRGDYASWLEISDLSASSLLPFPGMFDDYFVTALAIRLSPRFGAEPRKVTIFRAQQMEVFIRAQYAQTREQITGNGGMSSLQAYGPVGVSDGGETFV